MATITATDMTGTGSRAVTVTTLTGTADTFTYDADKDPVLVFHNATGGSLSPVIDGDGASTVSISGAGSFDISGGYAVGSIAAGDTVAIPLTTIERYLAGTIDITSATGIEAQLLEF